MKKKILSTLLIIALIAGMLVGLTACDKGDSKDEKNSTSKDVINSYEKALSATNAKELAKLMNAKEFTKILAETANNPQTYSTSDIEDMYNDLFNYIDETTLENYKIVKTYEVKDVDDLDKFDDADLYEAIEGVLDLDFAKDYTIYVLKLDFDGEDEYDFIVLNKNNEIVYNYLLGTMLYSSDVMSVEKTDLSALEIQTFNTTFTVYTGRQLGTDVKNLLDKLLINYNMNRAEDRIPAVTFTDSAKSEYEKIDATSSGYTTEINNLKTSIAEKHYYTVEVGYDDNGVVNEIIINY